MTLRLHGTVIANHPPQDGREWDCQCARCGSTIARVNGPVCVSGAAWCEAHPIQGRENVQRGAIEWFVIGEDHG